jgi:hypothetical protein
MLLTFQFPNFNFLCKLSQFWVQKFFFLLMFCSEFEFVFCSVLFLCRNFDQRLEVKEVEVCNTYAAIHGFFFRIKICHWYWFSIWFDIFFHIKMQIWFYFASHLFFPLSIFCFVCFILASLFSHYIMFGVCFIVWKWWFDLGMSDFD